MKQFFASVYETIKALLAKRWVMVGISVVLALTLAMTTLFLRPLRPSVNTNAGLSSQPVSSQESASSEESAPSSEETSSEETSSEETVGKTLLVASSVEEDLYIQVRDDKGKTWSGTRFSLVITYPNGKTNTYSTAKDGSCYLKNLVAGEYKIEMKEIEGFLTAAPITCTVKEKIQREVIEDLEEKVEIKDITEIPEEETAPVAPPPPPPEDIVEPEEIVTQPEQEETVITQVPVLDSKGNFTYKYTYRVGSNGFLLLRETGEESDVKPVLKNGVLSHGLRRIPNPAASSHPSSSASSGAGSAGSSSLSSGGTSSVQSSGASQATTSSQASGASSQRAVLRTALTSLPSSGGSLTSPGPSASINSTSSAGNPSSGGSLTSPGSSASINSTSSAGNPSSGGSLTSPGSSASINSTSSAGNPSSGGGLTSPGSSASINSTSSAGNPSSGGTSSNGSSGQPSSSGSASSVPAFLDQRVELFHEDNTPIDTYWIDAELITQSVEIKIGWQMIDGQLYYFDANGDMAVGLKKIDGQLYYFNEKGVKSQYVGIDVSAFNGKIDWNKVKEQGVEFAIIRLGGRGWGSGALYEDTYAYKQGEKGGFYLQQAKAAGLKIGAYFFSAAITVEEAVEEASLALSVLEKAGISALDYPIFFDTEYSGTADFSGRADNLSKEQRTAIAKAFCDTIRNSSSFQVGIYASGKFYKDCLDYNALSGYTIWMAHYTTDYRDTDFPYRYDIWQFTATGKIDGITGNVDMNVIL